MYTIRNNEVYENGEPTGIKAAYTKKELKQQYGWSDHVLQKRFSEIPHMIYDKLPNGEWKISKREFAPNEVCAIYNWFGLP